MTTVGYGAKFTRFHFQQLPTARNIWVLLESQAPGVVTDRIDIGGMKSEAAARFGGHGTSWTQNAYYLNGLNITDPYSGDKPLSYPDYDGLEELDVSTAVHSASVGSPGIALSMTPRHGGDESHVSAETYYAGSATQSNNITENKRNVGVNSPEHFKDFFNGNVHLEGQTASGYLNYFASFSAQDFSKYMQNVPESIDSRLISGLVDLNSVVSDQRLNLLWTGQRLQNPNRGVSERVPFESSMNQVNTYQILQAGDQVQLGQSVSVEFRVGYTHGSLENKFQEGVQRQSGVELFKGIYSGIAPIQTVGNRDRLDMLATLSHTLEGRATLGRLSFTLSNQLRVGAGWEELFSSNEYSAYDNLNLQFFEGLPYAVVMLNTPTKAKQRVRNSFLFLQDHAVFSDWLGFDLGLRLQSSAGWLPSGQVPDPLNTSSQSRFGSENLIQWTTISRRFGASIRVSKEISLRSSYARYYHQLLASLLDFQNPAALSGNVFLWNDKNGDRQYQTGEEGTLISRFGGQYSTIDPDLKVPYTDEVTVGADFDLTGKVKVGLTLMHRYEQRLVETTNIGVPSSAYSPVTILDRGGDDKAGTFDDQLITVYNQDPPTLGRDYYLLTNPPGFRDFYQGLEIVAESKDWIAGLFFQFSFAAFMSVGMASQEGEEQEYDQGVIGNLFDNPNTLINADGRLFFDRAYLGKIAAAYELPWDMQISGVAKYYDGLPFGRKLVVTGLNQGPFYILATPRGNYFGSSDKPGGHRVEFNLTLDLGIEKTFPLGNGHIGLRLDVFNLLNTNNNTRENDLSGPDFQARVPLETEAPRVFRLGMKYSL
ncbi:MAG: TonB-dependent receptor plug domain-containing protein [Bacteroidota bacterium]